MSESEKPAANLPMALVVILAMLGLATIPQGGGKPSEAPKAHADAEQSGSPRAATDDDKNLGPLATVKADLWPEPTETAMPKPASGEDDARLDPEGRSRVAVLDRARARPGRFEHEP